MYSPFPPVSMFKTDTETFLNIDTGGKGGRCVNFKIFIHYCQYILTGIVDKLKR